jgi:hypothetical protein
MPIGNAAPNTTIPEVMRPYFVWGRSIMRKMILTLLVFSFLPWLPVIMTNNKWYTFVFGNILMNTKTKTMNHDKIKLMGCTDAPDGVYKTLSIYINVHYLLSSIFKVQFREHRHQHGKCKMSLCLCNHPVKRVIQSGKLINCWWNAIHIDNESWIKLKNWCLHQLIQESFFIKSTKLLKIYTSHAAD